MSDGTADLIHACLEGDATSWEEVRLMALGFLRRKPSINVEGHEDIVQNVIIKLLKGFREFNGNTKGQQFPVKCS